MNIFINPLPRPDVLCVQLLGELVAHVNLVQTVPDPAPDIVRMELLEAGGRTTDNAEEAAALVLTALDPAATRLLPRLLVASGVDPSAGHRQPPSSLSFPMSPPRLDPCRGVADLLPPPGSPSAQQADFFSPMRGLFPNYAAAIHRGLERTKPLGTFSGFRTNLASKESFLLLEYPFSALQRP